MPKGWRNWFRRVSEKKGGDWELYDLSQCLTLSLYRMERNDPLLISASYFWSNTLNAFVFGHGPMTITLADVYMLTGLRITGSMQPYDFLSAGQEISQNSILYRMGQLHSEPRWRWISCQQKGIRGLPEHVAREICFLWVILWSNLQSQTLGGAPRIRQGHPSWKVSARSCLSSDVPGGCPIAEEWTSAYCQWPLVVNTTVA